MNAKDTSTRTVFILTASPFYLPSIWTFVFEELTRIPKKKITNVFSGQGLIRFRLNFDIYNSKISRNSILKTKKIRWNNFFALIMHLHIFRYIFRHLYNNWTIIEMACINLPRTNLWLFRSTTKLKKKMIWNSFQ